MSFINIPVSPEGKSRSSISKKSSLGSSHATSPYFPLDLKPLCRTMAVAYLLSIPVSKFYTNRNWILITLCSSEIFAWVVRDSVGIPRRSLSHRRLFSPPLSTTFWSLYCYYATVDSSDPHCRRLLYDILRVKFPTNFLPKIMKVKDVNCKIAQHAARGTTHESKEFAQLAEYHISYQSIVDSWPYLTDEEFILEHSSEYIKTTSIKPPAPCGHSYQLSISLLAPSAWAHRVVKRSGTEVWAPSR